MMKSEFLAFMFLSWMLVSVISFCTSGGRVSLCAETWQQNEILLCIKLPSSSEFSKILWAARFEFHKMHVFDDFLFDTRFVDPSFPETKVSVYSQTYLQFKVMSSETFRDKAWCIVYLGAFSLTHSAVGHILPKYQQLLAFPTFPTFPTFP